MMISRFLETEIVSRFNKQKAILLLGGRQVGKTTLLKKITEQRTDALWLNADEPDIKVLLEQATSTRLKSYFGKKTLVIIDEAQLVHDIGRKIKLITDSLKEVQVVATGSSAFEIKNNPISTIRNTNPKYNLLNRPINMKVIVKMQKLIENEVNKSNVFFKFFLYKKIPKPKIPEIKNNAKTIRLKINKSKIIPLPI